MGRLQFVRWCRTMGLPAEIYEELYPHTYLILWLEARRQSGLEGIMGYPEANKSFLEQDAEAMLAFEVLEEIYDERQKQEEARSKFREQTKEFWG